MFSSPIHASDNVDRASSRLVAPDLLLPPLTDPDCESPVARGSFGYLSAEKPAPTPKSSALTQAAALIAAAPDAAGFSPDPEAASFVRFVLHDVALMHDPKRREGASSPRRDAAALVNLRRGSLDLSSIYGPDASPIRELRDPDAPARMLAPAANDAPGAMRSADPRNALSPELSRMHRALIALHNMAVEECDDPGVASAGPDALFAYARTELRLLVQWLAMNRALPALCPPAAIAETADGSAQLFTRMVARMGGGVPPAPLEALLGAWPLITRSAVAEDLGAILTLGRRLALPSGQETVRAINRALGTRIAELTDAEICAGPAAAAMKGDMLLHTPLPLYLLREAAERGQNGRLGPVGGHVAAQTIAGLIFSDPYSYWLRPGNTGGRWRPVDGVLRAGGKPIDSIALLLSAAGG